MSINIETSRLINESSMLLKKDILLVEENRLESNDIVITISDGDRDLILKAGPNVKSDYIALSLLSKIDFPAPKVVLFNDKDLIITTKCKGVELRNLSELDRQFVIPELISHILTLSKCKSRNNFSGGISNINLANNTNWKEYLQAIIGDSVKELGGVNIDLEVISVGYKFVQDNLYLIPDNLELNLVHNDVNLTNCFSMNGKITGIIDWSDSIFGDWLYDVARLKMNLAQLSDNISLHYIKANIENNPEYKSRLEIYYVCKLIEYISIYKKYGKVYGIAKNQELLANFLEEN